VRDLTRRGEIDSLEVDLAHPAIVLGVVVEDEVPGVGSARPDRRAAHTFGLVFAVPLGRAERHIEIVEDAEDLIDRLVAGRGRPSRLGKSDGPDESRRGSEIAGQPDHSAAAAQRLEV
jgi:hypothetical protein